MILKPSRHLLPLLIALCATVPIVGGRASEPAAPTAPEAGGPVDVATPAIDRVLRVSIGADSSVATVATLAAPDTGEAVFWRRGDEVSVVARTGEPVRPDGGAGFGLRAIGRAWAAPGALLYLATTVEGPPVLVRHDAAGARVVAVGADPAGALVDLAPRPVLDATGCTVELEVFELLGAGAAPLAEDGSVRFPAWVGAPCDEVRASVRWRDGRYALEGVAVSPATADEARAPVPTPGPWRRVVGDPAAVVDVATAIPVRP